jgi:hypothetical protein
MRRFGLLLVPCALGIALAGAQVVSADDVCRREPCREQVANVDVLPGERIILRVNPPVAGIVITSVITITSPDVR